LLEHSHALPVLGGEQVFGLEEIVWMRVKRLELVDLALHIFRIEEWDFRQTR
jgi:hypothetical protein